MHAGVKAEYLHASLESVRIQSRPPDEVVVVEDGPLPERLREVLNNFAPPLSSYRRYALPTNQGAGPARQYGIEAAASEWIALVDSDDICLPTRFAKQLAAAGTEVDMVGSAMIEFEDSPDNIVGVRAMPLCQNEIIRYARTRMPVNNSSLVFRREMALRIGGYRTLPFNEDYDFVARALAAGAVIRNLAEPLVLYRTSQDMFRRRRAFTAQRSEFRLQRNLREYGLITRQRALANLGIRLTYRALPSAAIRWSYRRIFLSGCSAQMAPP